MFADAIDSHYMSVKNRIIQKNSSRVVAGLLGAQDWPPTSVKLDSFYLLTLGERPVGRRTYSAANPFVEHLIQWVWVIVGKDLQAAERKANRGDRYRTAQLMKGEIINALYPYYAEKQTWALDGNGVWTASSLDPVESIIWTPGVFNDRWDKASGVLFGAVSTTVTDMVEQATPLNI